MREVVRLAVKVFEHPDFAAIVKGRTTPTGRRTWRRMMRLDAWLMREVTTGQHLTSTCRMGPADDPTAVVDQRLRVHGLEGLRIADASVMPDTVRANTNATTIMIGERLADFVGGAS